MPNNTLGLQAQRVGIQVVFESFEEDEAGREMWSASEADGQWRGDFQVSRGSTLRLSRKQAARHAKSVRSIVRHRPPTLHIARGDKPDGSSS
jgi:hypothetical protein